MTRNERKDGIIWGYIGFAIGLAVGLILCGTGHI